MSDRIRNSVIGDKTSITLSVLIPIVPLIAWAAVTHSKVDDHTAKIVSIESRIDKSEARSNRFDEEVIDRLARMETKMDAQRPKHNPTKEW